MIYIFRDLRNILDSIKLWHMYLALMQSIISCGIVGWGVAFDNVLTELLICMLLVFRYTQFKFMFKAVTGN